MRFIDKIKIKRNPNIIDSWNNEKLDEDCISYAINNGYRFNSDVIYKFEGYLVYINAFKYESDFIKYEKERTKEIGNVYKLNEIYGKNETIYIIKQDTELAMYVLQIHNSGIEESDIIQIIDGNEELIEEAIRNYHTSETKILANYIASKKTPKELQEMGIEHDDFKKAYIQTANPEKVKELLQYYNMENIDYILIRDIIRDNLEQFIPYLDELQELKLNIDSSGIVLATMNYLKENEIVYSEKVPKFALNDREYVLMCLQHEPNLMETLENKIYYPINWDKNPEIAKKIADKITAEQIKFEIMPRVYQRSKEIYESIIKNNPELLQEESNRIGLYDLTKNMSEQEVFDYYKSIGYPFNSRTVKTDNFDVVLECLKNDYMTLANSTQEFTLEQYKQIYDILKDNLKTEEILSSNFLKQNPYFVVELLKNNVDIEKIKLEETKCYDDVYLELKAIALKNGIEIPKPKEYKHIIKFNGDNVYVQLDNLDSVKKGLEYLQENEIEQSLTVEIGQLEHNEFIIADNIQFFEELAKNGVNINFKYDTGKKIFPLEEVIRMEHFMQSVVEDIKQKNFSPLEQLVAVYDVVKVFKPYEHGKDSISKARALYEYLDNEYMVCAGYSDLIVNLGRRLNAPYVEIGLETKKEGHSRNYVNIVDKKYGIDGFYALDATWEQSGKMPKTQIEEYRSTYKEFLLTTEQGRSKDISLDWNKYGGYDVLCTMTEPQEVQEYFRNNSRKADEWFQRMSILDPEFYKTIVAMDFSKTEDAQALIEYFKTKINNEVPKEKILDAIIEVKKSIYVNLTEQDIEDIRMGYSITEPFCLLNEKFERDSLYGKEYYDEYVNKRYEELKHMTVKQAQKENTYVVVQEIFDQKKKQILINSSLGKITALGGIEITDENIKALVKEKKEEIENTGFGLIENERLGRFGN